MAAISAGRHGHKVTICEKNKTLGRKVLVTGAGRCNFMNENLGPSFYAAGAGKITDKVFSVFGKDDILSFFRELGMFYFSDRGRMFPVTNQAATVLKLLESEITKLGVTVLTGFDCTGISGKSGDFVVKARDGRICKAENVILAGGGKTYPALGSDGSAYELAVKSGHSVVRPVPSAVPLTVNDRLCHLLQGQRITARVSCVVDGNETGAAAGELLFTKYGLSGTAILDISEYVSIALNRDNKKDVKVVADMAPFVDADSLREELGLRKKNGTDRDHMLTGILPNKFNVLTKEIDTANIVELVRAVKSRVFQVSGTRGWNEAEFTSGGVPVDEVMDTLESRKREGLYLAGEILDIGARRGGYHLAWCWASGYIAGLLSK